MPDSKAHKPSTNATAAPTAPNDTPGTDTPDRPKDTDISKNTAANEEMLVDGKDTR